MTLYTKRLISRLLILAVLALQSFGQTGTNAVLITDLPTDRLIRVTDLSDKGIEIRSNVPGFSLNKPWHFSLDPNGRIYIADRDNNRIVRMDDFAGNGWKAFSGVGANNFGQLVNGVGNVVSVNVDRTGRIYVCAGRTIRIDDMDGAGWVTFPAANFPTNPSAPGSFNNPKVLVFDRQGRIYVSDTDNHRIVRFDDMQGTGWTTFGSKGNGRGQFYRPEGLAIDDQGRIYIADNLNHRIVRIDDMTGAGWASLGSSPGGNVDQFTFPHDIQVDRSNRIWVADTGNSRIVRLNDMNGAGWVSFGIHSNPSLQLNAPKGIQVLGLGPALEYTAALPGVRVGGAYRTSILAMNAGTVSANATVSLTVDGVPPAAYTRTLAPMGVARLDASSTGGPADGFASVRSSQVLDGAALLQVMSGTSIASEAAIRFSAPAKQFTVSVDNVNDARSGYVLSNFGTTNIGYTLTLRDKKGVTLETATTGQPLAPGRQLTEFADRKFPASVVPGFEGSIEFSTSFGSAVVSDGPGARAGAVGFRYDNPASDVFTTIPVIVNAADPTFRPEEGFPPLALVTPTTLCFPLIIDGAGHRTILNFVNITDSAAPIALEFFGADGAPLSVPIGGVQQTSISAALSPRGTVRLASDGTSSQGVVGWARVTSPGAIAGSEILQSIEAGRVTAEAGLSSSPPAARFVSHFDGVGFAKSEVAVCNPNNSAVSVTLNLRDSSGQLIATTTRTLPAFAQLSQFVSQIFPSVYTAFEGTLELVAARGASISEVALRYDNPTGNVFASAPVIPFDTAPAAPQSPLALPTLIQGGTVNAASFGSGVPVAPGSLATAFGINLSGKATLTLNSADAFLLGAYPGQINFQVPWELAGQPQASMTATIDGVASKQTTVELAPFSPGIFTLGAAQGAVVIAASGEVAAPIGSFAGLAVRPARRGEYITIYCTGLGAVTNQPPTGAPASAGALAVTTTAPSVIIGGTAAPTTDGFFSGLAPGFVGLYQVNVQVPQTAPAGDAVAVALRIGGVASNAVTMAIQ